MTEARDPLADMLARHRVTPPDAGLRARILETAAAALGRPAPLLRRRERVGLAGAGVAGVLAGALLAMQAVAATAPPMTNSYGEEATIFGDLAPARDG